MPHFKAVVRGHQFQDHPDGSPPGPNCPVCNKSVSHRVTLRVSDDQGEQHEVHQDCAPGTL
jgi:hypothetical protein